MISSRRADALAILLLIALWLLFFWRLFTPIEADQASLKLGDFSGQFVTFGGYQYARWSAGEVPLWNPYNNGGFPFIADTQAAVFYPPRLLTIALVNLSGTGWTYHALQLEMTFHVLFYSLALYALIRRMTLAQGGSVMAGLMAAVIGSYGGFLSGYPPLQLALLEAGVWLPLGVLGVLEATRARPRPGWLLVGGGALGLSWLAGHPQTSWFLTYLLIAFMAYRVAIQRHPWPVFVAGLLILGGVSFGLAAVQLIPGFEYLPQTARADFSYEAKGNGFPFRDVLQLLFPGTLSLFSPLHVGLVGLCLALIAVWRGLNNARFWGVVALIALGLSFGGNSAIFPALYNLLPGLRFFRGQERAAYLFANSMAILAGLGMMQLVNWDKARLPRATRNIRRSLAGLVAVCAAPTVVLFIEWLREPGTAGAVLDTVIFSTIIAAAILLLFWRITNSAATPMLPGLLVALAVFELFSIHMDAPSNYDPISPARQISIAPPPLVAQALADPDIPFRVDGFRGLGDNYGSLYGLADLRGISPLFLAGPYALIEPEKINPPAWEVFAVRYVYSDWAELPVPSTITAEGEDRFGPVNLHQLDDPRPFAHLLYAAALVDSDAAAHALLADPNFNARQTLILNQPYDLALPPEPPVDGQAIITAFAPEHITAQISVSENAFLSLSQPNYPGWSASLNGQLVPILRAYGGLSAIPIPAGEYQLELVYDPLSYRIGALLSLATWIGVGILGAAQFTRRRRSRSAYAAGHPADKQDSGTVRGA